MEEKQEKAALKSRLKVARKQAFGIFISIDGEAKALDTTSSRKYKQRSRKRHHASIRSVGGCLELLPTRNDYCFPQRLQKSHWISRNAGVIQNVCQCVRGALCGKRPGPRQQESTSPSWSSVQRISACSWRRLVRALRVTQVERTMFVERKRVLEIGAASADAPHKRDPRRQVSDEPNLSRMQHVRWCLGLGANRLFCQTLTVITQPPVVVLDDNSGSAMHFGSGAGLGRHNFPDNVATLADIINCHAEMASSNRPLGKPDN